MGASSQSFVIHALESTTGSPWRIRRRLPSSLSSTSRRSRFKRGVHRSGSRIERRVRKVKRLIPSSLQSTGLEGLFRDTADYILSLQSRVRIMQMMVNMLGGSK